MAAGEVEIGAETLPIDPKVTAVASRRKSQLVIALHNISKTAKTMYGLVCTKGHASVIKDCFGAYLLYARLSSVCKLILVSWSPH